MSAINPQTLDRDQENGRTNDAGAISVDSLVIAQVLGRAHRIAEAQHAPLDARTILHVAHSFADELSTTDPQFDHVGFIQAATEKQHGA